MTEFNFDNLGQGVGAASSRPSENIVFKDRTTLDDLTDVSWLSGEEKRHMKEFFLKARGQYFDSGTRVTGGCDQ